MPLSCSPAELTLRLKLVVLLCNKIVSLDAANEIQWEMTICNITKFGLSCLILSYTSPVFQKIK